MHRLQPVIQKSKPELCIGLSTTYCISTNRHLLKSNELSSLLLSFVLKFCSISDVGSSSKCRLKCRTRIIHYCCEGQDRLLFRALYRIIIYMNPALLIPHISHPTDLLEYSNNYPCQYWERAERLVKFASESSRDFA